MNEECFAQGKENKCKILSVESCRGHNCSFYKTREQFINSKWVAFDKIAQKTLTDQLSIATKYYDGNRPWLLDRDTQEV